MTSFWQHRAVVVCIAMAAWLAAFAPPAVAQTVTLGGSGYPFPSMSEVEVRVVETDRFRQFLDTTVLSPLFYVEVAGASFLDRLAGFPEEWTGGGGYVHRNVARFEQMLLGEAIGQGVAAALNHRVSYDPCACTGFGPRTGHAFARVLVSLDSKDGHRTANISRLAGAYGSAAIADFWYPASYTRKDIFVQATVGLALAGGVNMLKEFIFK